MMTQDLIIFAAIELIVFCIVLYVLIRANIFVNTLQKEVNELYIYLPVTIRDIKNDLKAFNQTLKSKFEARPLDAQEIGFLIGKIFSEIIFARFSVFPFKKKLVLTSIMLKLWNIRERLKVTFLKSLVK